MPPRPQPLMDRVSRHVRVSDAGCHEWQGTRLTNRAGAQTYGQIRIAGRTVLVHRAVFAHLHGAIPEGCEVRHRCDNPRCCNPDHLELGSKSDNMRDMVRRGRCANTAAKLTPDQVQTIRTRAAAGDRHLDIAKDVGIARSVVTRIVNRKVWSNLP